MPRAPSLAASLALAALLAACDRVPEPGPPRATTSPARDAPAASSGFPEQLSRPRAERLVAIGDLHGDLDSTRRVLRLAGAIDEHDGWTGGKLVVVQTGDEIDRGDDDRAIVDLIEALKTQAAAAGGELLALVGNHEVMNAAHDFRYVTPRAMAAFGERARVFAPGGPYAELLARRPLFVKVGDTVFVHGGILPSHVSYGLARMNDELHAWFVGRRLEPPAAATAENGPVWTRVYSTESDAPDCATLRDVLARLGARRMVVGHTVQAHGINAACDGAVYRIDVGLSRFFGGPIEALELRGDDARVLREDRGAR